MILSEVVLLTVPMKFGENSVNEITQADSVIKYFTYRTRLKTV